ncbi:unnamed protein product [Cuscuta campestris]|uniref:Uncharacterized protein n=1 Tax=Cuscuta campestris TaxID=132261 RepID=A0A484NBX3_9ASTE|nr:unnamed protein product [Cuscuta campestris]
MGVRDYEPNRHTAKGPTKPGNRGGHRRPAATRKVWRPAVPSWEKEFCLKASAGIYPSWDKFVEAKKYVHLCGGDGVMRWDDSAARDSFLRSKALFYAAKFNVRSVLETPSPVSRDDILYAEEVGGDGGGDSKVTDDPELWEGLDSVTDDGGGEEEVAAKENTTSENAAALLGAEEIKATGWDIEAAEEYDCNNLTGLVVGGRHGQYFCC